MVDHIVQWIGPTLLLAVSAAGAAVVRTINTAHRLRIMEEWRASLEAMQLPQCVAKLAQRLEDSDKENQKDQELNKADHAEIKQMISENRAEMLSALLTVKNDLITVFKRNNGNNRR